jgi:predicted nucleotidyltransferase
MLNRDYLDLLSAFSRHGVEYLLVGAYAMAVHGQPRATMDIDLWVRSAPENAQRIVAALAEFGAPSEACDPRPYQVPGTVIQIGVAPRRIDLLTRIDGVEFDSACARAIGVEVNGLRVPTIGLDDLIANKRATGRAQDRLDADRLAGRTRDSDSGT